MNTYAARTTDLAARGAVVALAEAYESRLVAGLPPPTPAEASAVFYGALGLEPEAVARGFAAADALLRENNHLSTKTLGAHVATAFFVAARSTSNEGK